MERGTGWAKIHSDADFGLIYRALREGQAAKQHLENALANEGGDQITALKASLGEAVKLFEPVVDRGELEADTQWLDRARRLLEGE